MTLEDLREHGILLPEEEWGTHRLATTTPRVPFLLALIVAVASWVVALWGEGGLATWMGIAAFIVTFFVITWMLDRAVLRQRRRVRSERKERRGRGQ